MFIKSGWLEGTRIATGRFREEQSKINWVRMSWVGLHKSLLFGKLLEQIRKYSAPGFSCGFAPGQNVQQVLSWSRVMGQFPAQAAVWLQPSVMSKSGKAQIVTS